MAITFGPLDTVEVSAQVEVGLLLSIAATASRIDTPRTETNGFADLGLLLSVDGRSVALLSGQSDVDVGFTLAVDAAAVVATPAVHTSGTAALDLVLSLDGTMESYSGDVIPTIPASVNVDFALYADAELEQALHLTADVDVAFALSVEALPPNFCEVEFLLHMDATSAVVPQAYGFLVPPPPVMVGYAGISFVQMIDQLALGSTGAGTPYFRLKTGLGLGDGMASRADAMSVLRTGIAFEDGLSIVFRELMELGVVFGATGIETYQAMEQLLDTLLLGAVVSSEAEGLAVIVDALGFGAVASTFLANTMTDGIAFGDALEQAMTASERMVDELLLSDADSTASATMVALMTDRLGLSDAQVTALDATAVLRDNLGFMLRLNVDNEQYIAFSINAENKGVTRYTQYPFNSFARIGGQVFGATDTGIYRMDGDTDDGQPIHARLRLGLSAMGTQLVKGFTAAYLGRSASGDLFVKVVTAAKTDGEREANVYRLRARNADTTREGRVPFGRGIRSVYYDFVIENVDEHGAGGADFSIDVIEFLPMLTQRRIRGDSGGKR